MAEDGGGGAKGKLVPSAEPSSSLPQSRASVSGRKEIPTTPLGLLLQTAGYGRAMISHGMIRTHALSMMVDDAAWRFVFYDHSKIIQSQASWLICTLRPLLIPNYRL